ncbi:uncharacterized protein Z518_05330 [Rhinocladiella mackenziei CBS 650.93]|uniref:GED domain-containing protein n=1 Tax=Rhinocladiella mackenziei CBS 650.93 TaxID=1442369 RepID=A0A0D2FQK2_9EURO|nr:uncharacterized protein Z518_05330 [Rhinocladiella mackenziei CBS 650.93]KIX04462.1 hypothetical protein Z518_05330 [Rhinocladiella mackenziei CBS 650.93]
MALLTSSFATLAVDDSGNPENIESSQPQVHLQIPEHDEVLDIIDTLRSQGITRYIDLPQLIVCGDQSSGKSSVLEAISGGFRFPTKDALCTRFAIELILRRDPTTKVNVTIEPHEDRPPKDQDILASFEPPTTNLDQFPAIIEAAAAAMGVDGTRKAFSKDILRVELWGPHQPHLTLIDLPGLFHAGNEYQSRAEAASIHALVRSYMKSERSIILAVVSAKNDYSNQIVTEYAREFDPQGHRTLGIITKPDTLHTGSESQKWYQSLAENGRISLKLGWHFLRNRDFDTRDSTTAERDEAEEQFFRRPDWNSLPKSRVGIKALRPRLSRILLSHISKELPKLLQDVRSGVENCQRKLNRLGRPRRTVEEQRTYLVHASQTFMKLMQYSVDGSYLDPFFGSSDDIGNGYQKRLRAVVQNIMKDFARAMRLRGHAIQLVDYTPDSNSTGHGGPTFVARENFLKYVEGRMNNNRGRELPGTFNPDIIGELFFDQAKPWEEIIHYTREQLMKAAERTIDLLLEHLADPATAAALQRHLIGPHMEEISKSLHLKAEEVLRPYVKGHPLTFNEYFIENIQKKRRMETRKLMAKKISSFFGKDPEVELDSSRIFEGKFNVRALLDALVLEIEVDADRFACVEATNAMEAYYEVALKAVIDAFGMYAMEVCLLDKLPHVFDPREVHGLEEKMIRKVAAESPESIIEREDAERKLSILEQSLKTLQRMKIPQVQDGQVPQQGSLGRREAVRDTRDYPSEAALKEVYSSTEDTESTDMGSEQFVDSPDRVRSTTSRSSATSAELVENSPGRDRHYFKAHLKKSKAS